MTIHSFVDRFTQLFSWLYYRHQWEEWELLAAAGVVLLPLLWVAKKQRDERKARTSAHSIRQSLPIIGVKLAAGDYGRADVTDSKRHRLAFLAGKKNGAMKAAEPSIASNGRTRLLQHEIIKRQQTEAYLEQKLDELKAVNEKLRTQINQGKKTEEHLRRRMAKLLAAGKKLRQELGRLDQVKETLRRQPDAVAAQRFGGNLTEPMQARKHPKWPPLELLSASRLSRGGPNPRERDEEMLAVNPKRPTDSRRANEPLDVEKLKAIAALARQIQRQPRHA